MIKKVKQFRLAQKILNSPRHALPGSVRFSLVTQHKVCLNEKVNGR